MSLLNNAKLRNVSGILPTQKTAIKSFMRRAIYAWIRNRPGQVFAVRDLVGGPNWDWSGTPLYDLFDRHHKAGKNNASAMKRAAIDLGWLVKSVLAEDKRSFLSTKTWRANGYSWIGNEP